MAVKIAPLGQQDVTKIYAMTDMEFPGESRSELYDYLAFCLTTDKKFVRAAHAVKKTFKIQNYETASAIIRQVALTTAAPPPLEVLSKSTASSSSDPGDLEIRSKRGRPYKREAIDGPATKRSKSGTKASTEPHIPQQNTTSFRNAEFKQARYLLAPMSSTIDGEARPYSEGNQPLRTLTEEGIFFIRGVQYQLVPPDQGGYIGGGAFGKVWLAQRNPAQPLHEVLPHHRDVVSELLNRPQCCVKMFRVEAPHTRKSGDGAVDCSSARREMQLHARSGHYVDGVMSILAVTPVPAGSTQGPVRIHERWTGLPFQSTHWVVMAVEVARHGNLRQWIHPVHPSGHTRLTLSSPGVEEQGAEMLARVLCGRLICQIDRMHSHGILHLDLKPANITVGATWRICIIDFGQAQLATDPNLSSSFGTPGFRAPEARPSVQSDIFSLGMILYCLLVSASNAFAGTHYKRPVNKIYDRFIGVDGSGPPHLLACIQHLRAAFPKDHPQWPKLIPSREGASLMMAMVQRDPRRRPSLKQCLQHSWLKHPHSMDSGSKAEAQRRANPLMHWTEDPKFDHLVRNAAQAHPRGAAVNSLTTGGTCTGPLTWKQLDKAIEVNNDSLTWQLPSLVTPGSEILTLGSVTDVKEEKPASAE